MGLLNSVKDQELNILAIMYAEGAKLLGTSCNYYKLVSSEDRPYKDSANDPIRQYEEPVLLDVIFESQESKLRGTKVTLEHDDGSKVANIPRVDRLGNSISIVEYSKLEVLTPDSEYNQVFDISNITIDSNNPVYFICKLTPHRVVLDLDLEKDGVQDNLGGSLMMDNQYLNYKRGD